MSGTTSPLNVGDLVTWTHSSSNGKTIKFSTRSGEIIRFSADLAMAKMRNGKRVILPIARFRKAGEGTEITDFFKNLASAITSKEGGAA